MTEILPGTKVDIRIQQEASRSMATGQEVQSFVSKVFDVLDDGSLELDVPSVGGKLVLLPLNIRYELIFSSKAGMRMGQVEIVQRYKRGNFYIMKAVLTSKIERFQRREYYRLQCALPSYFLPLDMDEKTILKLPSIHAMLQDNGNLRKDIGSCTILDLSGGGARFVSRKDIGDRPYVLLQFTIDEGNVKTNVELFGKILENKYDRPNDNHLYRVKFLYRDSEWQETIVKYIFEQQRRIRRKEQGDT
ncbi:MAG: flagellar brake domain-containing protein [Lachnospiraceae bacterium]|nr:flagellar brake domain-containing protein [Lachnospiraceae bacterium]